MSADNVHCVGIWPWRRLVLAVADVTTNRVPEEGCLVATTELMLSTATVGLNQPVTASVKFKNTGQQPLSLRQLAVVVHGLDEANKELPPLFFPGLIEFTLQPGEEYEYRQIQSFSQPGNYYAETVYQNAQGQWNNFWPYPRVKFRVGP